MRFTFAAGSTLASKSYAVIAKDTTAFRAIYGTNVQSLFGPYAGELDNGGETVALLNANAEVVEFVDYNDKFPWPIGADALGNNRELLPPRRDKFAGNGVNGGGGAGLASLTHRFSCDETSGAAADSVGSVSIPFAGVFQPSSNGRNVCCGHYYDL